MNCLKTLGDYQYYSILELEKQGVGNISRLPVSVRIVLESLLRNLDGVRVTEEDVKKLAQWSPKGNPEGDVPFIVSRVILQDFTGVPLLVDLAAMRDAIPDDPSRIEPLVPVDLVVDHSVQVDRSGTHDAYMYNLKIEFERNKERYEFLKWGQQAFKTLKVVPPGIGIVHQVNLEHIATVVAEKEGVLFPDTLVGTDSHTTMINGLGVVGWGVGGIEAEAAMLDQPVSLQMPDVIGVHLSGSLNEGVTATDLTLRVTQLLREENVVGKFVEFHGEGAASLSVADRATIGNMSPEYGATMGFFPVDEKTLDYLRMTGREEGHITRVADYLKAQGLFGIPRKGEVEYTKVLELDLNSIQPCIAGPKRPQDRIDLPDVKAKFHDLLTQPIEKGGYGKTKQAIAKDYSVHTGGHPFHLDVPHETGGIPELDPVPDHSWSETEMVTNRPITDTETSPGYSDHGDCDSPLSHGSIVIAAITSCTNTSNPSVMLAAGLVAKKAVEKGLKVDPTIKTSLAPGSRVVTDYLEKTGLQQYLNTLGFNLVAYGCTTCIGNSGPLDEDLEAMIKKHDLITASVLSGNRNFEARIHGSVKANFLMSPPLVVAYALAGRIDKDLTNEPLGTDKDGHPVYLKDIWPTMEEVQNAIREGLKPEMYQQRYANIMADNPVWKEITAKTGSLYPWDEKSTYIQRPPYLDGFQLEIPEVEGLEGMRPLALFGDSVTTDHISPAGAFMADTPAGHYLIAKGVDEKHFNSYGSRRGNHHVMMRGTFANVRIRNLMADGKEGGYTKLMPEGKMTTIFKAAEAYAERETPLIVFAGKDYGMGSSRDWAAKGASLLGVKAVVAVSFERIHRSNLIGMGILPLEGAYWEELGITGDETFSLRGFENGIQPQQEVTLEIHRGDQVDEVKLRSRLDTPIEVDYYRNGGIMPYILRNTM